MCVPPTLTFCLFQAFFELAQANRAKAASGGQRIGEAGYDQRMQATRRLSIIRKFGLMSRCVDPDADDMFMLQNFLKGQGGEKEEGDEGKPVDPVHWYGLFAPQSLKDAQSRFVKGDNVQSIG